MKTVNYVDYKYSYVHFIKPKMNTLKFYTFGCMDKFNDESHRCNYVRKIVINEIMKSRFTDKENEFYDNIKNMTSAKDIYYYCKNSINKAEETFVNVDDEGNLIE